MNFRGHLGSLEKVLSELDPTQIVDRAELADALRILKSHSSFTFESLGKEVGRPATTLHGWFTGRHLPYQRDNASFEILLGSLGVVETGHWMMALARVRLNINK